MQKEILSNLVDEPKVFKRIKLNPANYWQRFLQWARIKQPVYLPVQIQAATLRTVQKIALIILGMRSKSDLEEEDQMFDLMQSNVYEQARVIATAIHNSNSPTPQIYIDSVMDNLSNEETKNIVAEVYRRLDIQSFFDSMQYLKSLIVMTGTQETIASQPLSETPNLPTN